MERKCSPCHGRCKRRPCAGSNQYKCPRRTLSQLSEGELRRVDSALNASADLCGTISRKIHQIDSKAVMDGLNGPRCQPRSLDQLSRWELQRVHSALSAAANLCDSTSRDIYCSDSEADLSVCPDHSLMHEPFTCRCLALTLTLLHYLQGKDARSDKARDEDRNRRRST